MRSVIFVLIVVVAVAVVAMAVTPNRGDTAGEAPTPVDAASLSAPSSTAPLTRAESSSCPAPLSALREGQGGAGASPAAPALPPAEPKRIEALHTAVIPLEHRLALVAELQVAAARGDASAAATLLAAGRVPGAAAVPALQALGHADPALHAAIRTGLQPHLASTEASIVMAALGLIGRLQDPSAIPAVEAVLAGNRDRADGFAQHVWEACARALAGIGNPRAIPILARELRRVGSSRLACELDYGSELVEALRCTGSRAAIPPLTVYAKALRCARPASGPRRVQLDQRLEEIDEALAAVRRCTKTTRDRKPRKDFASP